MNYATAADIRQADAGLDGRSHDCAEAGEPLIRIYTLGRFGLVINNQTIAFAGKAPRKPLQVLKALIALGGRGVSINALMLAVWPELGRAARPALDVALMRLRKLLCSHSALTLSDGKLTLDERECWVDAWRFERTIAKFDTAVDWHSPRDIFVLYRGRFLEGEDDLQCVAKVRDRLAARFRRITLDIARAEEHAQRWQIAAEIYRRCLEHENLEEEFYSRLMYCEWRLGRRSDALKTYRRCCDVLRLHFYAKPSAGLSDLYRRVTSDESAIEQCMPIFAIG
jgi:DNA-binding SARP family transcriptional activator